MEKISTIIDIKFVSAWEGKEETLFFHELQLENGDKGKLQGNTEEHPDWLKEGAQIRYDIRPGSRGSLIKVIAVVQANFPPTRKEQHKAERLINPQQSSKAERMINPGQTSREGRKEEFRRGKGRLDDDPKYWEMRQKCISLTTCLDHASELVIGGVIDLKDRYELALQDFNFITHYSELDTTKQKLAPEFQKTVSAKVASTGKGSRRSGQPDLFASEKK